MKKTILIITVFSFLCSFAQDISYLDSLKKVHKKHNAVILKDYDKITIDIKDEELVIKRQVYKRMFYTNNKAQAYSEDDITSSSFKIIDKLEFFTEVRKNNKYKKIKGKKYTIDKYIDNDVFYQDEKTYNFVYPSLCENAISNLKYTYHLTEPRLLLGNFFKSVFPIEDLEFIVDVDENIDIDFVKYNFDSLNYDYSVKNEKHRKIYSFKVKKIKALDLGDNPPPIRYTLPHVLPYIKSYKTKTQTVNILRNNSDLYAWYKSLLNKSPCTDIEELSAKSKEITDKYTSEKEQAKAIFNWVQNNIKYIAVEVGIGGFVPEKPSNVYKNKYGDCKGMAYILYNMLKSVDIESHITWVGTTDLPYKYSEIPSPVVDNHMITTYIDSTGNYYYLDATNENLIFGFPSAFIQGKQVMIEKNDSFEIRTIPVIPADENQIRDSIYMKIEGNNIIAKGNVEFTGYNCIRICDRLDNIFEEKKRNKFLENYIERGNNKFSVEKTLVSKNKEKNKISIKYDFSIGNYITQSEDEIFINMNIFKSMLTEKIKKDRKSPMRFYMKNSYKYYVELEIPNNYKLEHLPPNSEFENDIYKYYIKYTKKDENHLIYEMYSHYNTLQLNKEDFYKFNEFIEDIHKNFRELVILKKIN